MRDSGGGRPRPRRPAPVPWRPASAPARTARRADAEVRPHGILNLPRTHAVYGLAADLLLVFKPRGHREAAHVHPHRQRLRVLRGRLRIATARRTVVLTPAGRALSIPAGRVHTTVALADTWLTAEKH